MTRRIFCKVLLVIVAVFGLLVLSGVLSAQGRSEEALEHVKDIQERNIDRLMAIDGVEGTAIGYNQNERLAVKVFVSRGGVAGIPRTLDGVPVQVVVTGKFYALRPPKTPPGQDKKNRPPNAPTGLTATAVSSSQIDLSWTDNANNEKGYNIERKITGSFSEIATVGANETSYSNTGLVPSTTYTYRVCAYNDAGASDFSDEVSATTLADGSEPPEEKPPLWCERPVPIGVSTGHPDITAGTIGCRVTRVADDNTTLLYYALSNNHVYANLNKATIGDNVLQPGSIDGGVDPDDAIGTLAAFEPIKFGPRYSNTIDAPMADVSYPRPELPTYVYSPSIVTLESSGPWHAVVAIAAVFGTLWLIMRFIQPIHRFLGRMVCTVFSKVMCLFIASIGVHLIMAGLLHYFSSPK